MQARRSSRHWIKTLKSTCVLLALTLPGAAQAGPIFDFFGEVAGGDVAAPFAAGDPLTGFIELTESGGAPGTEFTEADLLDFTFTIGAVTFNLTDSQPFGFFDGIVSIDGSTLDAFNTTTSFGPFPNCSSCSLTLNAGADSFVVTVLPPQGFGFAEGGLASSLRQPVPGPAPLVLLSLGMLLLVSLRQRQALNG